MTTEQRVAAILESVEKLKACEVKTSDSEKVQMISDILASGASHERMLAGICIAMI